MTKLYRIDHSGDDPTLDQCPLCHTGHEDAFTLMEHLEEDHNINDQNGLKAVLLLVYPDMGESDLNDLIDPE